MFCRKGKIIPTLKPGNETFTFVIRAVETLEVLKVVSLDVTASTSDISCLVTGATFESFLSSGNVSAGKILIPYDYSEETSVEVNGEEVLRVVGGMPMFVLAGSTTPNANLSFEGSSIRDKVLALQLIVTWVGVTGISTTWGAWGSSGSASTPKGIINLWSGAIADIPIGWILCDGGGGTPNLRDKFIIGAGSSYGVGEKGGSTTSNATTLTIAQMPSHTHKYYYWAADGSGLNYGEVVQNSGFKYPETYATGGGESHTHGVTPPYFALAYIMKL